MSCCNRPCLSGLFVPPCVSTPINPGPSASFWQSDDDVLLYLLYLLLGIVAMSLPSPCSARGGLGECSYPPHNSFHDGPSPAAALRRSEITYRQLQRHRGFTSAASDRGCSAARANYETAQSRKEPAAPQLHFCRTLHSDSITATRGVALRAAVDAASTAAADLSPGTQEAGLGLDRPHNGNGMHKQRGSNGAAVLQGNPGGSTTPAVHAEAAVAPEDFQLIAGELSMIDRGSACSLADVFRCTACTRPECQVRGKPLGTKIHGACTYTHTCTHIC